jgi:hypothetical protein
MEQISFFLAKFKNLGLGDAVAKAAFTEVVEKVLGVKLGPESVKLKDGTFFVSADSVVKSELFLKRSKILTELASFLGSVKKHDVR